jgi:hypothetical protein
MIGIVRKDSVIYVAYLLIFTAVQVFSFGFSSFGHLAYSVTMFSFLCFLVCTLPVVTNEYGEKINRGYSFLKTLPVTDKEIVLAKFLVLLAAVALYTGITWFNFRWLPATPYQLALARVWLMLNAAVGMTLAGGTLVLVYRFGLSTLMTLLSVGLGGAVAGYITMAELLARGRFDNHLPVLERVAGAGWAVIAAAGLGMWFVLLQVSIILKRRYHAERS